MKTLKYYHDLYLKWDILPLTDVFKKLEIIAKELWLRPSHYLNSPAVSWDAMVNMTKVKLELISDPDLYIFFEKDMRGAVSYISNRHI